jgi:hypothetical protein
VFIDEPRSLVNSDVTLVYILVAFVSFIRYDCAVEKKVKILDTIHSLDLPNNPLDDIIDQVVLVYAC